MLRKLVSTLAVVSILGYSGTAALGDTGLTLSTGLDYSTGKYGSASDTEIWYLPLIGKFETGPLKLTVPYIRITGPGNVVGGAEDIIQLRQTGAATRHTASGLGDVVAAASYSVYENRPAGLLVDVTGKIKFGTADETKGLGTGENDYAIQGDVTKGFGKFGAFARWAGSDSATHPA